MLACKYFFCCGRLFMRFSAFALCLLVTPAFAANLPWPAQPVLTLNPQMQQFVAADATLEQLADGFRWAEGPVAEPGKIGRAHV